VSIHSLLVLLIALPARRTRGKGKARLHATVYSGGRLIAKFRIFSHATPRRPDFPPFSSAEIEDPVKETAKKSLNDRSRI